MKNQAIHSTIQELSNQLVNNWPLYSFVTSNPLAGFEHLHFEDAITKVRKYMGINGYPSASVFEQAWKSHQVERSVLEDQLVDKGINISAETSLARLRELEEHRAQKPVLDNIDRHIIKWLAVFLDQGSTEWAMPHRKEGFYKAWKKSACYDTKLPNRSVISTLPGDAAELIQELLSAHQPGEWDEIFRRHLLALPGWTGYIKYRIENPNDWQQAYPITLTDYLAVRLILCQLLNQPFLPKEKSTSGESAKLDKISSAWLKALELSYQELLVEQVASQAKGNRPGTSVSPEAQFVFCIDTRSERIRRAVEQAGNYQTYGYAGFFGVAMDYKHPEKNISHKSCPPILDSEYEATEQIHPEKNDKVERFSFYNDLRNALNKFRFTLKNNIPASFGYVESAGFFYGIGLLLKTLSPTSAYRSKEQAERVAGYPESFSNVTLSHKREENNGVAGDLSTQEKAEIAKTAFELMGWEEFAPLVIFAGHGSQTANNPFESSLDCGACAGNKGRHNARLLANICNNDKVRTLLAEQYNIQIPGDTWFLAAEHNTTTNYIRLFDQDAPVNHQQQIKKLKDNLASAQHQANVEQFDIPQNNVKQTMQEAMRRAADWAETRPEWGLAGNASFIIGPRKLTSGLNLQARSFLHSYDWEKDPGGKILEAILQGPMVVTQWINNHYYFASVDNDWFGSGTKVTQNVTGNYGVVQGNGGDLKCGLPLESLQEDDNIMQHLPLRLTVLIHAPKEWVISNITTHASLSKLVKNEWIYLAVLDPTNDNQVEFIGDEVLNIESEFYASPD